MERASLIAVFICPAAVFMLSHSGFLVGLCASMKLTIAVRENKLWIIQLSSRNSYQVKSTLFRQGSPISHCLVSKGAMRKLWLHDNNLKIKNYFKIMYKDFKKCLKAKLWLAHETLSLSKYNDDIDYVTEYMYFTLNLFCRTFSYA